MSRKKQTRRRATLPLPQMVIFNLKQMRHSLSVLNGLMLPSELSLDARYQILPTVALQFQHDALVFVSSLLCALPQNDESTLDV